jgi:hypothetical protein
MSNTPKKEYVAPEITVVELERQIPLLESSPDFPETIPVGRG